MGWIPQGKSVLSGFRVLDLTDETGWLAGRILGDLGADVVKIEPPGGDPGRRRGPFLGGAPDAERSLRWLALNTSKRGVVLDLSSADGARRFEDLVARADAVLESFEPGTLEALGLGAEALCRRHARLVWCSLTPFGRSGPHARRRAHDLVVVASGGNAWMTGDADRAPLRCSLPTSTYHAGAEAALGTAMALFARERSGRGQRVDVSAQECQLGTLMGGPGIQALSGRVARRSGARTGRTREIWPAADGEVSFGLRGGPSRAPGLAALVAWMHECGMAPGWLREIDWARWRPDALDDAERARFEAAFGAFFRSQTRRELTAGALERRILLAPCNDARDVLEHPQLRARGLFTQLPVPGTEQTLECPGFFARTSAAPIGVRRRAPRLGEHQAELLDEAERPRVEPARRAAGGSAPRSVFEGVNVLELAAGAAGPLATRVLAEHGARVVRVESRRRPDFLRLLQAAPETHGGLDASPMFVLLNANKESVGLDLSKPEGAALVRRLALEWADVLLENFSPGVMARAGLDPARLRESRPELITLSSCLFGQTGPWRSYPGFGGQGSAIAGFNHLTGWPDREAIGPWATITDSLSPRYAALALTAALIRRRRTGEGCAIDLSQIEAGVYSLSETIVRCSAEGEVMVRRGNRDEHAAPHGIYPCRGADRWIAIAVHADAEWRALRAAMGEPAWARDERFDTCGGRLAHADLLDRELPAWTRRHDAQALAGSLQAAGVEAGPVQDFADLLRDPQLAHREHFVRLRHAHLGELWCERSGLRLSETPSALYAPGPCLGEHDQAVLGGVLGLSSDEIARLVEQGVVA